LGCFFYVFKANPYHFKWYWNGSRLWQELRLGIPLVGIAFLMEFLKTLDRLIIAKKLGFYEVGLYSIAMMVNTYVYSFPMMFSHVWYPNLLQEYGRSGGDPREIKNYLLKPIAILSILVPALCSLAIFWVPAIAGWLLPKFMAGIPAMKIYLVGTFFVLLAQFSGNFLVTLDKYWVNIPILAVSIGVNFAVNQILLKMGYGLSGVAAGTAVSFVFYGLGSYFAAMRPFAGVREIAGTLLKLMGVLAVLFGGAFALDFWIAVPNPILEAFLKTLIYFICVMPFFLQLEKKTAVFQHIADTFLGRMKRGGETELADEDVKSSLPE